MTPERWKQIEDVFQQAADLPDDERVAYLDRACDGDAELRSEVESLLESEGISHVAPALEKAAQSVSGVGPLEGKRLGAYRIETPIGEGGMGTVYRAVRADGQFDQQVAIKIIRPGAASAMQSKRFLEERNFLAQLQHPYIARLIDGGDHSGIPYLVMELVDGVRIDEYCRQWNLSVRERLELFLQVCEAVQHAHSALIVHRDLKPSNIFVSQDGVPKLLDFGIATLVAEGEADGPPAQQMMTPDYASPEQVLGEPIGVASDVYSLGIVLYELLTGERPYSITEFTPEGIRSKVCETSVEAPSRRVLRETRLRRQIEGDLDNILLMALRKEPGRRYGSVAQFAEDIRRHIAGETVIARPDTFTYRWSKFVRRNRMTIGLAAALMLTLVVGAGLTAREGIRAQRRFEEVRTLANSLLNEVDPEAARLLGSAKLRRLIVERSLTYLDRLSREAGSDVELRKELARAYHRVGDIQGHGHSESLGLFAESLESHRKGLAIEEPLLKQYPNDQMLRRSVAVGFAHIGDLYSRRGSAREAADYTGKAYAMVDRADPEAYVDVRLSMARTALIEGRFADARRVGQEAADVARGLKAPVRLVVLSFVMGEVARFSGDARDHMRWVQTGIEAGQQGMNPKEPSASESLRLASLHALFGEYLYLPDEPSQIQPCAAVGQYSQAADVYERALVEGGRVASLMVPAASALQKLAMAQVRCGGGDPVAAVLRAIEAYGGRAEMDPNNDIALGIVYFEQKNLKQAAEVFERQPTDALAHDYRAVIAMRSGDRTKALALLAKARELRDVELKRNTYMHAIEAYRQARNLAQAMEWGDRTEGLKQQALHWLEPFPKDGAPQNVEDLRAKLQ